MKKVLLTATVQSHICQFHQPLVKVLHELGYEVHVAARDNLAEKNGLALDFVDCVYDVPFARSPFSPRNVKAYRVLKRLIRKQGYSAVHCNTPVGGVLTRLACKGQRKKGLRVLYTAHGFHFYQGAPIKNWLYYPIEWLCARWTDRLITITKEDYALATRSFKTSVCHIHGVGANHERYFPISDLQREALRLAYGISSDCRMVLCVGELLPNKNQKTAIAAMSLLVKAFPTALLCIAGNGPCESLLKEQIASLGLGEHVRMLGYTTHLHDYYGMCDAVVSCSYREGLPMNVVEAMLCARPVIASDNRGHRELVEHGKTGYLVDADDVGAYAERMSELFAHPETYERMCKAAQERAQAYTAECVMPELAHIYQTL